MTTGSMPQFESERRRRDERRDDLDWGLEALAPVPVRSAPSAEPRPIVDERLVSLLHPTSGIAEQYRALRTNLLAMRARGRAMKTLAITSARRGDGKTITSANIAAIFAEVQSARIALVDADLRSPGVSALFGHGTTSSPGLAGYLRDGASFESVVVPTPLRNLALVPAGFPIDNPTELLASPRFRDLVDRLGVEYDFVFFDTPPVLAVTDAAILGARIDGIIFVVKMNDSEREAVDESLEALKAAGAHVIGAVLTNSGPGEGVYSRQRK